MRDTAEQVFPVGYNPRGKAQCFSTGSHSTGVQAVGLQYCPRKENQVAPRNSALQPILYPTSDMTPRQ